MNFTLVPFLKTPNRYFTSVPHIGGSPAEKANAEYIRDKWLEQGLDSAKLIPYDVLLSYPNPDIPNKVCSM